MELIFAESDSLSSGLVLVSKHVTITQLGDSECSEQNHPRHTRNISMSISALQIVNHHVSQFAIALFCDDQLRALEQGDQTLTSAEVVSGVSRS